MQLRERGLVWLAALARAEACPLRLVPRVEEAHIGTLGKTRRTTGAAINAGRLHRNVELAGEGRVASNHGLPAGIVPGREGQRLFEGTVHYRRSLRIV